MADADLDKDPLPTNTPIGTEPEDEFDGEEGHPAFQPLGSHNMGELVEELDNITIRGCKVDACLDLFIARVLSFVSERKDTTPQPSPYQFSSDLDNVPEEKLKEWEKELRENLNRLIPEYVSDNPEDMMKRVETRLSTRAKKEFVEPTQLAEGACGDESDRSVPSLDELEKMIQAERATALFSCGGTIPIPVNTGGARRKNRRASPPVSIFWGKKDGAATHKVILPVDASVHRTGLFDVQRLVAEYDFATSFHPADFGILDHVAQILLPSISSELDNQLGCRRIKAELYKLNVYSGPSGLFRKHVDTPRGASGILNVEHHGHEVTFDWSDKSDTIIQWAAFYSDCEHEIETITNGDRVTLTYNLCVTEPIGGLTIGYTSVIDPKTFSIYGWIKNLFANDNFMENGGILGFGCSHAYAHSSDLADTHLPRALKGADLVIYSVLLSLEIKLSILPVLDGISDHRASDRYEGPLVVDYLRTDPEILTSASLSVTECEDTDQSWKKLYKEREESDAYDSRVFTSNIDKVGTHCHAYEIIREDINVNRKIIMFAAWLTAALVSPRQPPPTSAPEPTSTTTTTPITVTETITETNTVEASLGNLCIGLPLTVVQSVAAVLTASLGDLLPLGKLQECAGNSLSEKPLTGLFGLVGGGG
ncbi:hypothetical protein BJX62DRAFT_238483 [Aspergillus germanicus]